MVGSIIICFGNILDISLLHWEGEEEVFEPLNPVHLAVFLLTAMCERVKATLELRGRVELVVCFVPANYFC